MTQDNKPTESKEEQKKPQDNTGVMMTGHIKIFDPETGEAAPAGAPKAMFETFRAQYAPKTRAANRRVAATAPAIGERPADDAAPKEAEGTTTRLF